MVIAEIATLEFCTDLGFFTTPERNEVSRSKVSNLILVKSPNKAPPTGKADDIFYSSIKMAAENFDNILDILSQTNLDKIDISLSSEQFIEFKRLLILGEQYPYNKFNFFPTMNDDIHDAIEHIFAVFSDRTITEKMILIEFPLYPDFFDYYNHGKTNMKVLQDWLTKNGKVLEKSRRKLILYDLHILTVFANMELIRKHIAVQMSPLYGYFATFFEIATYSSKRPVTSMDIIVKKPQSLKLTYPRIDELGLVYSDEEIYCAVVRYAHTETGGTYYEENVQQKFCGTFYYLELESSIFLNLGFFRVFRNKYMTFIRLKQQIGEDIEKIFITARQRHDYELCLKFDQISEEGSPFISNYLPEILDVEPENMQQVDVKRAMKNFFVYGQKLQYTQSMDGEVYESGIVDPDTNTFTNSSGETEYLSSLYATEDRFDQIICIMARHLEIDCVILTHMVGRTRMVQEIMDTRERDTSYKNLFTLA